MKNQRNVCTGVLFGKFRNVQAAVKVMFANSIPTLDIAKSFFAIPMDNNEPTHIRIFAKLFTAARKRAYLMGLKSKEAR